MVTSCLNGNNCRTEESVTPFSINELKFIKTESRECSNIYQFRTVNLRGIINRGKSFQDT